MGRADRILEDALPEPFRTQDEMDQANVYIVNPTRYQNMPLQQVRTEHLIPTQKLVSNSKVAGMVEDGIFDRILVAVRNNKPYIIDGHHRWSAAKVSERPHIWCHIWNMDPPPARADGLVY